MIQLYISRPTQELKYYNAVNQLYITTQFKVLKYHDNMNYLDPSIEISCYYVNIATDVLNFNCPFFAYL